MMMGIFFVGSSGFALGPLIYWIFFYDDEDIFLWVHLDDDEDLFDFMGNFDRAEFFWGLIWWGDL
jgi:hypothetical protein